jgi:hypothetical protein
VPVPRGQGRLFGGYLEGPLEAALRYLEGCPVTSLPVIAGFDFAVCVLPVPRRARYGQDQIIVVLLALMLIRIVDRARVEFDAEGEQFLPEHIS